MSRDPCRGLTPRRGSRLVSGELCVPLGPAETASACTGSQLSIMPVVQQLWPFWAAVVRPEQARDGLEASPKET